jgi:hypothetical protein
MSRRYRIVWHNPGYLIAEVDADSLEEARDRVDELVGDAELYANPATGEYVTLYGDREETPSDQEGEKGDES